MNPTPRQIEVLRELWSDKTRKQAGAVIGITQRTVDHHIKGLRKRTRTASLIRLFHWGIANGYLTAELPRCKACGQTLKAL